MSSHIYKQKIHTLLHVIKTQYKSENTVNHSENI